jgi:hypothetical protein
MERSCVAGQRCHVNLGLDDESIQIRGLRRSSFTLLDREIGIPTAEYGR